MYKTEKYDWSNFEEISLDSDKLCFEFSYTDPNSGWYCAKTAKFSGDPKTLEEPIAFTLVTNDESQGPIKLSEAINRTAYWLPEGGMITGWEIKPCDEDGSITERNTSFEDWMIDNTKSVVANKDTSKVIPFPIKVGGNG